jgi:hypothetical protein
MKETPLFSADAASLVTHASSRRVHRISVSLDQLISLRLMWLAYAVTLATAGCLLGVALGLILTPVPMRQFAAVVGL